MQKYGLQIPGRLVLDLNSPIGFRLEQVPQEASVKESWKCGNCGGGQAEHGLQDNRCVFTPVLTSEATVVKVEKSWDALVAEIADLKGKLMDKQGECERLRLALDIISNHGVQYPWAECARIARAALAQPPAEEGR